MWHDWHFGSLAHGTRRVRSALPAVLVKFEVKSLPTYLMLPWQSWHTTPPLNMAPRRHLVLWPGWHE